MARERTFGIFCHRPHRLEVFSMTAGYNPGQLQMCMKIERKLVSFYAGNRCFSLTSVKKQLMTFRRSVKGGKMASRSSHSIRLLLERLRTVWVAVRLASSMCFCTIFIDFSTLLTASCAGSTGATEASSEPIAPLVLGECISSILSALLCPGLPSCVRLALPVLLLAGVAGGSSDV
jgi:hypothetical protein